MYFPRKIKPFNQSFQVYLQRSLQRSLLRFKKISYCFNIYFSFVFPILYIFLLSPVLIKKVKNSGFSRLISLKTQDFQSLVFLLTISKLALYFYYNTPCILFCFNFVFFFQFLSLGFNDFLLLFNFWHVTIYVSFLFLQILLYKDSCVVFGL